MKKMRDNDLQTKFHIIKHSFNKKLKKNSQHKANNQGMTMVEVLMGFVVLMVFLGGMSGIITFSSHMLYNSLDIRKAQQQLQSEVYKTSPSPSGAIEINGAYKLVGIDHEGNNKEISITPKLIKIESQDIGIDEEILKVKIYGFK